MGKTCEFYPKMGKMGKKCQDFSTCSFRVQSTPDCLSDNAGYYIYHVT